ncbi:MAG: hypothetical protein AUJ96_09570 [Armatimonadetes bacterium CG2_30_66_41]|nr:hypothetical protein [Armatimonadota bacterium]NDK11916.1 hypothetical protein [Armatimonadota bacterium]OIP06223.1 MAG: hypothetical protein AUJ96_09570 [Armatimonadetes bacterium CG2_30_66_41]
MSLSLTCIASLLLSCAPGSAQPPAKGQLLERLVADFETGAWTPDGGSMAPGDSRLVDDVPADLNGRSTKSMEVEARYSGKGFAAFGVLPPGGAIPGACRTVNLWTKPLEEGFFWLLKFKGPDGKDQFNGRNMEADLGGKAGEWHKVEFTIPLDWPQPLALASIVGHNWGKQADKADAHLRVDDLRVATDLSGIDPAKTKLLDIQLQAPHERNVFLKSEPVRFSLLFDSWLGKALTGNVSWSACQLGGQPWAEKRKDFEFTDLHSETIALEPTRFGVHELTVTCEVSTGDKLRKALRFSFIPAPHTYTAEEKQASPWGINIHGGNPGVAYDALARTGFNWVRDYAYTFEWLLRARGDDGRYAGWPWYPKMDAKLKAAGLRGLPCLSGALDREAIKAGRFAPDRKWKSDLMHVLVSFPDYTAWELDNEYDYTYGTAEAARDWAAYKAYHETFGRAVNFLDDKLLAVEQGTAGIFPEQVGGLVKSGAFDQIDVVNCHHYCGTDAPELNTINRNVGGEEESPRSFFDALRDFVAAGRADGKQRQAWLTEFGWDTLAGHIVSEPVQAAYLQRGYLLGLSAGIDKLFWYWNRDTKEPPKQFFDGCGIWNPADEPKPASAAMAAMVHFLKLPQPVGTFELGDNTFGQVLRDRGRLVACAFKLQEDGKDTVVEFGSGECFDMYGNPLKGRRHALTLAPIWIDGVSEDDPLVKQAAFDLKSPWFMRLTAGDAFTLEVRATNRGATPLRATCSVTPPKGWTADRTTLALDVPPGQTVQVPFALAIPDAETDGQNRIAVTVREGQVEKRLATTIRIDRPLALSPVTLSGASGRTTAQVRLRNRSKSVKTVRLKARVPAGWEVTPADQELTLPAAQATKVELPVTWRPSWQPEERAELEVLNEGGQPLAQAGLIPPVVPLPRVANLLCDGKLDDWPAAAKLPDWALGCDAGKPGVAVYAGYSAEGLHLAVKVDDSRLLVTDPKAFWLQDCLEVFVDTANDKQERKMFEVTDHQFWLCPLIDDKRVYVGRWKRFDEIPATIYDLPGVKSFAAKQGTGYVVEAVLPAAALNGFSPAPGKSLGLCLNLTVQGRDTKREVYWPRPKDWTVLNMPSAWGTAELK